MNKVKELTQFLGDVKTEVRKVTFPSRKDTIATTWVVIALVILISIYLGLSDWFLSVVMSYII